MEGRGRVRRSEGIRDFIAQPRGAARADNMAKGDRGATRQRERRSCSCKRGTEAIEGVKEVEL